MSFGVLVDTGPLVAFLRQDDPSHAWAKDRLARLTEPLLTCDAVMAEVSHLLRKLQGGRTQALELVRRGVLRTSFRSSDHAEELLGLMEKYADTPMSFADACLVRMAELHDEASIMTLDSDFRVYRKHGDKPITLITPEA